MRAQLQLYCLFTQTQLPMRSSNPTQQQKSEYVHELMNIS